MCLLSMSLILFNVHVFLDNFDELVKSRKAVTPAKAGVHSILEYLDSRFRGNDRKEAKRTFCERINSKN